MPSNGARKLEGFRCLVISGYECLGEVKAMITRHRGRMAVRQRGGDDFDLGRELWEWVKSKVLMGCGLSLIR